MSFHIAPLIREMEQARISLGLLPTGDSVGYTVRKAQETAGTVPTPVVTPAGGIGNFWFANQQTAPSL